MQCGVWRNCLHHHGASTAFDFAAGQANGRVGEIRGVGVKAQAFVFTEK